MVKKQHATTDAVEILHRRHYAGKPKRLVRLGKTRSDMAIGDEIHRLRTKAGLTQRDMAELVGTTASVICRLEDADYTGHSLSILQRIAAALKRRLEIRFVEDRGKVRSA